MKLAKQKNKSTFLGLDFTFFTADIAKERKYLFENIALMISGGLSISDVLDSLREEVKSNRIKRLITNMNEDILSGKPFWKALERTKLLSEHLLSVVRIGEESGRLSENLRIVVEQQERDADFRSKVRSASLYPGIVTILMVVISLGIAIFILPQLSRIYQNIGVELPTITKIMISIGNFMSTYGYIVGPGVVAILFLIIFVLFINSKTKFLGQFVLLKVPVINRLLREAEISRLGFLLGTLLDAGIPLNEGIGLLNDSANLQVFKKVYSKWKDKIESGYTFKEVFDSVKSSKKLLPIYARQAILTGERTGSLSISLIRVGEIYKKKNENTSKDLSVLLEPVLLIIVWLGVSLLAFSIILPIYSLVGNVNQIS
ncbi:type II secretion system F family protein, partial [Candidatus Dojkabacteria bacterium]|nr:type II secretion system F family protein [Candidatus Dojkabacteria bacterium]